MRLDQLTFTRFLAAISIVAFHYGGKSFVFNNDYVSFMVNNADLCVSYFFILSGFVMMIAYGNKSAISAKDYFRNRFARIYPLYFLALLMMLFLQIRINNLDVPAFFLNLFMIQSWVPDKVLTGNPPGWSLSVELIFYLIFPFVLNWLFTKFSFKRISVYIISFWILSQVVFNVFFSLYGHGESESISRFLKFNPVMHLNEFLIGNLAGFFFVKKMQHKEKNYDFQILGLVALIILALKFPLNLNFHNGLLAVFFIPLIFCMALNNGFITQLFKKRAFVFLGEISFGIYIFQHPIYCLISAYTVNKYLHLTDPTIVFFIRFFILIIFSAVVYIYIEKPIQNKIKIKNKPVLA